MSSASLTSNPSKPRRSRSRDSTFRLSVAGAVGSTADTRRCEVITAAVPASTAAANGSSSLATSTESSTSRTGRLRWLSCAVSPWPGKCLTHAATPVSWSPSSQAATCTATFAGSAPKLRTPITGLSGLLFTSATGPRSRSIPTAASSAPIARPVARVRTRSSATPSAAGPSTGLPVEAWSRVTSPPSSSTAMTAWGDTA